MAVYVDHARIRYRGMLMNHMIADTLPELHAMAELLGLRRYFQDKDVPHYDICCVKRDLALRAGAVPIDRRRTAQLVREWRARKGIAPRSAGTSSAGRPSGPVADGSEICL
jgi:hypothetical protein